MKVSWKYSVYQILVYKIFAIPFQGWFGAVEYVLAICPLTEGCWFVPARGNRLPNLKALGTDSF